MKTLIFSLSFVIVSVFGYRNFLSVNDGETVHVEDGNNFEVMLDPLTVNRKLSEEADNVTYDSMLLWKPPNYPYKMKINGGKDMGCYEYDDPSEIACSASLDMTPSECDILCASLNYKYYEMHNVTECKCKNSYKNDFNKTNLELCSSECPGLPGAKLCGGVEFSRVFEINGEFPEGGVVTGCYKPSEEMTDQKVAGGFSAVGCMKKCQLELRQSYAAVYDGNKCQCGNTYGANGSLEFEKCQELSCQGKEQNICGGPEALMIYSLDEYYDKEETVKITNGSLNYYKTDNFNKYANRSSIYFHIPPQPYMDPLGFADKRLWSQEIEENKIQVMLLRYNNLVYYNATMTAYKLRGGKRSHISNGFNFGTGKLGFNFDATAVNPPLPYGEYTAKFYFIGLGWHQPYKVKINVEIDFHL